MNIRDDAKIHKISVDKLNTVINARTELLAERKENENSISRRNKALASSISDQFMLLASAHKISLDIDYHADTDKIYFYTNVMGESATYEDNNSNLLLMTSVLTTDDKISKEDINKLRVRLSGKIRYFSKYNGLLHKSHAPHVTTKLTSRTKYFK